MMKNASEEKAARRRPAAPVPVRILLGLLFILAPGRSVQAGGPPPRFITDGLPHVNVYDMVQAPSGLSWIATENGLCSYDGNSFHNYTVSDGLPSNRVLVLSPDPEGNLWVGTQQGVCIWRDTGVVYTLRAGFPLNVYRIIHAYPYVYLLTVSRKLHTFDVRSRKFTGKPPVDMELIAPRAEGGIWALSYNGLYYMQGSRAIPYAPVNIPYNEVYALIDRGEDLLLNYQHALYTLDKKQKTIQAVHTAEPFILGYNQHLFRDSRGDVWTWSISGNGTVHRLHFAAADSAEVEPMAQNIMVTRFYEDHSGDMWFATYGSGIQVYPYDPYRDRVFERSAPSNTVSMYVDPRLTLIGTNTGLYRLSKRSLDKITLNVAQEHVTYIRKIIRHKGTFYIANSSVITDFAVLKNDVLGNVVELPARALGIFGESLLMATNEGEFREYALQEGVPVLKRQVQIPYPPEFSGSVKDFGMYDNYYLAATTNGVYVYTKNMEYAGHILPGFNVFTVCSSGKQVFLGTSGGLYVMRRGVSGGVETERVIAADASVYCYVQVSPTCLAFGTSKGILVLDGGEPWMIDRYDHLFAGHTYAIAYDAYTKTLLAGANNSVFRIPFDPAFQKEQRKGPSLHFTSVRTKGNVSLNTPAGGSAIAASTGGLDLAFSTYDYSGGRPPRFRYSLNGQPVQYTGSDNLVFGGLRPGAYTLHIEASSNGLEWGTPLELSFRVHPEWYQRLAFRLLFIAFILTGTVWITASVLRARNRRRMLYFEYYQLQLRINRAKNIPHYTSNVLSILEYLVTKGDARAINRYFTLFNRFNTLTLREAHQVLRPLKDELEYAESFLDLEKLRLPEEFSSETEIGQGTDKNFPVPNMIVHTLVENAVKHGVIPRGKEGLIRIRISQREAVLQIIVEDNGPGPGADPSTAGTGFGLQMLEEQLELLRRQKLLYGRFEMKPIPGADGKTAGTRCTLWLSERELPNLILL